MVTRGVAVEVGEAVAVGVLDGVEATRVAVAAGATPSSAEHPLANAMMLIRNSACVRVLPLVCPMHQTMDYER